MFIYQEIFDNVNSESEIKSALEALVDKHNLSKVLFELADLCHEKSDHTLVNWQDRELGKKWLQMADRIHTQRNAAATKNL